ncbi:MAG TPA: archaellin/type IV pilin N-terminal domain-containing protein [Candidatus Bathyarchaeia archaeon]|jgi:flagellin-like protein|nr:archaellin/type IV pilin N-terminal domain-containing protein [Candidatus Bathyarchaeia archaeon]
MMKMKVLKSKKALSPVVASIILIAVTVAVSIAVAAWMGALTIGFMGSSSITITDTRFYPTSGSGSPSNYINITLKNTGTKTVTINQIKINNAIKNTLVGNLTLVPGDSGRVIRISNVDWVNGNPYKIDLYDTSGNAVGSTQQNSPGT